MSRKSKSLSTVLHALKDLDLARLAVESRTKLDLEKEITGLRMARMETQNMALDQGYLTPSSLLGADIKWLGWAASRIEAKTVDLAKIAARREQLKSRAQLSLGRAAAFDGLLTKRKNRARRA